MSGRQTEDFPENSSPGASATTGRAGIEPLVEAMRDYVERPDDWRSLTEIYDAAANFSEDLGGASGDPPDLPLPVPAKSSNGPNLYRLPDGRNLAWRGYGPMDGAPVVLLASPNSSSLQPPWVEAAAFEQRLRLIAVERPGVGRSTPHPGASLESFAADLRALLDQLGHDRVGLMGHATGALFALGAAHGLGPRVTTVLLRSARLAPIGAAAHGHRVSRSFFRAIIRAPWFTRLSLGILSTRLSDSLMRDLSAGFFKTSPVDQARLLADPSLLNHIVASMREATVQGFGGLFSESELMARAPPAFKLTAPVHIWHGAEDLVIPPSALRAWIANARPASLRLVADHGHLLQSSLWPEAFALLAGASQQPAGRRTSFSIAAAEPEPTDVATRSPLSPREQAVLSLLAHGRRPEQISHLLGIARATVDLHARNARRKLNASNLTETVAIAIRLGLI